MILSWWTYVCELMNWFELMLVCFWTDLNWCFWADELMLVSLWTDLNWCLWAYELIWTDVCELMNWFELMFVSGWTDVCKQMKWCWWAVELMFMSWWTDGCEALQTIGLQTNDQTTVGQLTDTDIPTRKIIRYPKTINFARRKYVSIYSHYKCGTYGALTSVSERNKCEIHLN